MHVFGLGLLIIVFLTNTRIQRSSLLNVVLGQIIFNFVKIDRFKVIVSSLGEYLLIIILTSNTGTKLPLGF